MKQHVRDSGRGSLAEVDVKALGVLHTLCGESVFGAEWPFCWSDHSTEWQVHWFLWHVLCSYINSKHAYAMRKWSLQLTTDAITQKRLPQKISYINKINCRVCSTSCSIKSLTGCVVCIWFSKLSKQVDTVYSSREASNHIEFMLILTSLLRESSVLLIKEMKKLKVICSLGYFRD